MRPCLCQMHTLHKLDSIRVPPPGETNCLSAQHISQTACRTVMHSRLTHVPCSSGKGCPLLYDCDKALCWGRMIGKQVGSCAHGMSESRCFAPKQAVSTTVSARGLRSFGGDRSVRNGVGVYINYGRKKGQIF